MVSATKETAKNLLFFLISNISFFDLSSCFNYSDTSYGENYIFKWFFLFSFFTDRYIHHRQLCVVSLKSPSGVDGIKRFFRISLSTASYLG